MRWARANHPQLYSLIAFLPWVRDGLNDADKAAIDEILSIAVANPAVAKAMFAYGNLFNEYHDNKPAVQLERYDTDYTPNLTVTIARLSGNPTGGVTPELVAKAARLAESVMQMPLPDDYVLVVVDDRPTVINRDGYVVSTDLGVVIILRREGVPPERLLNTLVHEIAHHWWRGNSSWVDEGLASTIDTIASAQQGHTYCSKPNGRGNCTAVNISDMVKARHYEHGQFCHYYLGERLFRALRDAATPDGFAAGLQRLYRTSWVPRQRGYRAGLEQVRAAFPDHVGLIEQHWSGGVSAVVWTQQPTYRDGLVSFAGYLRNGAALANLNETSAAQDCGNSFSISNPIGKDLGDIVSSLADSLYCTRNAPGDVIAEQYIIGDGRFEVRFRWPAALGHYSDKRITVWGYENAEHILISDGVDVAIGRSTIR